MDEEFKIRKVLLADSALREEIGQLRKVAWASVYPEAAWLKDPFDQFDKVAHHWAVFHRTKVVASGRLSIHGALQEVPDSEVYTSDVDIDLAPPIASLNRLVVDANYRRRGIAESLDTERINFAVEIGCRHIVGSSPGDERRIKQLCKLGFDDLGSGQPYRGSMWCQGCLSRLVVKRL